MMTSTVSLGMAHTGASLVRLEVRSKDAAEVSVCVCTVCVATVNSCLCACARAHFTKERKGKTEEDCTNSSKTLPLKAS